MADPDLPAERLVPQRSPQQAGAVKDAVAG